MEGFDISKVSEIYVGSSPVSAIYLGSNKLWPATHDYSKDYLTFEAIDDTTFTFSRNSLQYSLDDGSTWSTLAADTATPTVLAGNKILWKQTGLTPTVHYGIGTFSATGNFEASGNIMSLYYGDEFVGQNDLTGKSSAFKSLFYSNGMLINVKNLILPATTLENQCYVDMFSRCGSLTTAPELPATTLVYQCYAHMFDYCGSLTAAPELPATTLAQNCYYFMFESCRSLTAAPELPATTLVKECYFAMFNGCINIKYIKMLATDISAPDCLSYWLNGVSSTGTFIKDATMTTLPAGVSGIPNGWTVQDV